ncbi:hypothetical protein [Helicobacter fennelliae]|uniref:hypothetical protein n=1 Tax=Helicobacter fennelliae TaxID=215 RepID=UPI0011BEF874|nr:hypothetical protein [Helicobacter fennelliae]
MSSRLVISSFLSGSVIIHLISTESTQNIQHFLCATLVICNILFDKIWLMKTTTSVFYLIVFCTIAVRGLYADFTGSLPYSYTLNGRDEVHKAITACSNV